MPCRLPGGGIRVPDGTASDRASAPAPRLAFWGWLRSTDRSRWATRASLFAASKVHPPPWCPVHCSLCCKRPLPAPPPPSRSAHHCPVGKGLAHDSLVLTARPCDGPRVFANTASLPMAATKPTCRRAATSASQSLPRQCPGGNLGTPGVAWPWPRC